MSAPLSIACLSHMASVAAPTGAERSLALLAAGLSRRGHRVLVVVPGDWVLGTSLRAAGVELAIVPSRSCWLAYHEPRPWPVALAKWARFACSGSRRRLARRIASWGADVVHVNGLPHVHGAAAGRAAGRPVVWHLREILPAGPRRRWMASRVRRHARAVVAVSQAVASWVREEGLEDRLHVVYNGVEPPTVAPDSAAARHALGLPPEGVIVSLIGQLVAHKGAAAFVEAARRALSGEPALRFMLAGHGPPEFRAQIEALARASGRAERFHLLPAPPAADGLLAASDVVCLATTQPDPLPRAVLEAMAAGRPVVAFRDGGVPEMIRDGETGLLVEPRDIDGLAAAFVRLGRDPAWREALGRAGAARAVRDFSLERHLDRMERLLGALAR
jgi:glycosyltransferase involved in cell wall biosynthesis